jgi:hypothetical protein
VAYTHQGWLTEDQAYLLMGDESDEQFQGHGTRTYIWNLADLAAPINTGNFTNTTASIDHNIYIKGGYAYLASYRAGLRIFDISDIANANLSEVAYFDIYPADDNAQFNGAWSNYPFFASETVIVSGIEQGLYVLTPNLIVDPPGTPTANIVAPTNGGILTGSVLIQIDANDVEDTIGSLDVTWSVNGGTVQTTLHNIGSGFYEATWDTTLIRDGAYTIDVVATDSMNQTGNDSVNVTVDNVVDVTMHVGNLEGIPAVNIREGNWNAEVIVTVHDAFENLVSNATVSGSWGSCVTGSDGSCRMAQSQIDQNISSVIFVVNDITLAGFVYDMIDNHDPNGDSDGTTIEIVKP